MKRSMKFSQRLVIFLFALLVIAASVKVVMIASSHHPSTAEKAFYGQADLYFDNFYLPADPARATALGVHTYDDRLEDLSKTAINNHINELKKYEKIFASINTDQFNQTAQGDRDLILNNIRSQLLTLENIKQWQKNPDLYTSSITNSAFVIMSRNFAAPETRLKSLIAREKQMPGMLAQAHKNLKNPPKIYTEIALEQLPGIINFFKQDVPQAFQDVKDPALLDEFVKSNNAVVTALQSYQIWLQKNVLPRSHGEFRIGKQNYRKKLLYDEMVDTSLPDLLAINAENMRQNQKEYVRVANAIDPDKSAAQVAKDLDKDHPASDQLLLTFTNELDDLIRFIKDKEIITIPSEVRPILEETPPFLRAITFASMDTPGPFEKVANEAFFNVTLPSKDLNEAETREFMSQFNYASITSIAAHETYPGHYVQFLWVPSVPSRVRKILGATTNVEGWAHYCEQMMLDEGFGRDGYGGKTELDALKLRLGQLQNALLRNARFVVGIKLHTGQMTFNQAVDYFVKEGKQTRQVGLVETKRATSDPTYLYYTLGKIEILKLREDVKKKLGDKFNLMKFHNDFMRQGFPPIKIVRKAMLGTG